MEAIVDADAAYGNVVPELFRRAGGCAGSGPSSGATVGYYHQASLIALSGHQSA
jgi:hypothetical protein